MTVFLFIFLFMLGQNEAARILAVFPTPSISHQVVFRPLVQELVKRGHQVVVITIDPAFPKDEAPTNLTEIDVHNISYKIWNENIMLTSRGYKNDLLAQLSTIIQSMVKVVDAQLQHKDIQDIVQNTNHKFDLFLVEAYVKSALIFSHIYKVPVIQVSSFSAILENYSEVGAAPHPILLPTIIYQRNHNFTMWEKINQVYHHFRIEKICRENEIFENELFKKYFGKGTPVITELLNNVHMLFLNIHPMFEGIRPVPPAVIYMGGMHQKPEKELPSDLKLYLDSSKNGVIYLSFGTNVDPTQLPPDKIQTLVKVLSQLPYDVLMKWNRDELPDLNLYLDSSKNGVIYLSFGTNVDPTQLPPDKIQTLVKVLSQLPYDVLMKWNRDELPVRSDNIKIFKWLPQSDLLRHPKIKLFITQGGLQSTDEAITADVPLVGIPMLGDQWFNVDRYVYHKIEFAVDFETLNEAVLNNSINTVLMDDSYRKNIIRLGELMRDETMKPLERAVWWTEYVLRHGGAKHLRSPIANISWAQYLELEVVLILLAVVLTIIFVLLMSLTLLYKYVLRYYVQKLKNKIA